ncbi:MAG: NAD+ synthase [Gammaproteobacteria bacterium]
MAATGEPLSIALAQINLLVGDVRGNTERVIEWSARARELGADIVIFPELTLTSYPPEDLLLRKGLYAQIDHALARILKTVRDIDLLIGYPQLTPRGIFNTCSVLRQGRAIATYHKQHLPNYSVFDEKRYFVAGDKACVFDLHGVQTALTICEDVWVHGTCFQARAAGARLMLNINGSPYHLGKTHAREEVLRAAVREGQMPIVYVNLVGGQDELIFDGGSMVMNAGAEVVVRAPEFKERLEMVEVHAEGEKLELRGPIAPPLDNEASVYTALVTGVRDYIGKNRFKGAIVGLSGGIDSALTLAIAVDALGADAVEGVLMPSRYTAQMSIDDARAEAQVLGVRHQIISIEEPFKAFDTALGERFAGLASDTTEENIQARCRGIILMAISNKTGKILLTTGNKSEMACGYATLYGDMAGGFAPLKDVPKMMVYRLAKYRNSISANGDVVPQRVFDRPPTAELRENQTDQDSLPPYPVLDAILERYVEHDETPDEIIAAGFDAETVKRVVRMVDRNEYKRRQAAPGVKISARAFGRDRRYPITSGYTELES